MKYQLKYALIATLLVAGPAWAEEDLPLPVQWGGTGSKAEAAANADEDTPARVTFGDGAQGKRLNAKQAAPDKPAFKPDGTPVRSKVEVRGWDPKAKKPAKWDPTEKNKPAQWDPTEKGPAPVEWDPTETQTR